MEKKKNVSYREVSIDGMAIDRNYKNPMTKVYQYEYALYLAVSDLFQSVRCRSMCIESLMLYYKELPKGAKDEENQNPKETVKRSQKKLLEEMEMLVAKNVVGNISFPMTNICAAEVYTRLEKDGTHTFIFTDGIYGFSVHLEMQGKGHPKGVEVRKLQPFDRLAECKSDGYNINSASDREVFEVKNNYY